MGVVAMTINGTSVIPYLQSGSLSVDYIINGRPTLKCKLRVRDGDSYRPTERHEVAVTDGGTLVFGGVVFAVTETDVVDYKHRELDVDCVGYEMFADKVLFNGIIASTNLKAALTTLVTNLGAHGISVLSSMSTGPTVPDVTLPFQTIRQGIELLAVGSGWNAKWDHEKHVTMQDPGTVGAPFALTDTNSTILSLKHTKTLGNYCNELWYLFGDSSQREVTDGFTGDGSTKTFALHYAVGIAPGNLTENGTTWAVGVHGVDTGYRWYYRSSDTSLVVDAAQAAPSNGHIISVPFTAQFPSAYFTRDATEYANYGPFTIVLSNPNIFEWTQARYAADGELSRRKGVVRRVVAETATAGLEPGMTVNVTATKRGLSSVNFLIERVSIRHQTKKRNGEHLFFYEITAIEGNQYQQNWLEYFRQLNSGIGTGSASGVVGSGGSTTSVSVTGATWGGSREFGDDGGAWRDVFSWLPVKLDGTTGTPHTVRAFQRTDNSGTSVQVRVVKVSDSTVMATGAVSTSTSWDEELLTFTPSSGATDYKLQFKGANTSAQVYAIGQSL